MWLDNAVKLIYEFTASKGAAVPVPAVTVPSHKCPSLSIELALVLTEHFIEPIQLTNSAEKCSAFFVKLNSNEPQSHQLRNSKKARAGQWL